MMRRIQNHEVIVHGVEHEQYFRGCGVSFTDFTDVATGIGVDAAEAFEDALEALAQSDWDVDSADNWKDKPSTGECKVPQCDCEDDHDECANEGVWCYVSVRVTEERDPLYDFAYPDFQQQLEELLELAEEYGRWTKVGHQLSAFSKIDGWKGQEQDEFIASRKILEECKCLTFNEVRAKVREHERNYFNAREEFETTWGKEKSK